VLLLQNCLEFSTNIDVTKYQDGKRETYNPEGRAHASTVWDFYQVRFYLSLEVYLKCTCKFSSALVELDI